MSKNPECLGPKGIAKDAQYFRTKLFGIPSRTRVRMMRCVIGNFIYIPLPKERIARTIPPACKALAFYERGRSSFDKHFGFP